MSSNSLNITLTEEMFINAEPVGIYGAIEGDLYLIVRVAAAFMVVVSLITLLL